MHRYGDQQLVLYNVECPENHIAYFNLTFSDIEAPTCIGYSYVMYTTVTVLIGGGATASFWN